MLLSLHVKNLALIEEEEVTFTDGLNILTVSEAKRIRPLSGPERNMP